MTNFTDVLNTPVEAIEKPKPLPVGTYMAQINGAPKLKDASGSEKEPDVNFPVKILSPGPDVDVSGFSGEIAGRLTNISFWCSDENGMYRLKRFLTETLRIDGAGKTLGQLIAEAPGKQFMVKMKHVPSKDGTEVYANVESTAAL